MSHVIALVSVGAVPTEYVALVEPYLTKAFAADVIIAPALAMPANARDQKRDQYLARVIVDALALRKRSEWSRLLGVVAEDLYAPHLNFVFGEADAQRGV